LSWLTRPFRDFLQLEDVAEYDAADPVLVNVPGWKRWALITLSSSMWLPQSVLLLLGLVRRDHISFNVSLITMFGWVSCYLGSLGYRVFTNLSSIRPSGFSFVHHE
jgi:hypothetical protein